MTETTRCAGCGEAIAPDERFCSHCGVTALWHSGRRNVATGTPVPTTPAPSGAWDRVFERLSTATAGSYDIIRELGRGGMAAVYLAREVRLSRLVAIKVMSPALLMDDSMVDRFRQEAVTLANVNHPNIVPIFTVQEVDDLHFFVMKFIEGRDLDAVIHDAAPMPVDLVRAVLFEVGGALAAAHRRGIVHRDVKPANVLIDTEGTAIVTDFGIAKVAELPGHTVTGATIGTPAYMSPEQCLGDTVTGASDQYSLGVVAYQMLTGQTPFGGPTLVVMRAHIETPPRPIREWCPDCPDNLADAVLRMLAKAPDDRWPTLTQALTAAGATAVNPESAEQTALAELASRGVTPIPAALASMSPAPFTPSRMRRSSAPISAAPVSLAPSSVVPASRAKRFWWVMGPAALLMVLAAWWLWPGRYPALDTPAPPSAPTAVTPPPVAPAVPPSVPAAPPPAAAAPATAVAVHIVRRDSASRTLHFGEQRAWHVMHGVAVSWRSSEPEIAAVNGRTGLVTAGRQPGPVWLIAEAGGAADSTRLLVVPPPGAPATAASAKGVAPAAIALPPPPPTPPPAQPSPAAIPRTAMAMPGNADVSALIAGCLQAFNSRDPDHIMRAYNPRDDVDQNNLKSLLKAASGARFSAALSSKAAPSITNRGADGMNVIFWTEFQVSGNFAVGSGTRGPFAFSLESHHDGGKWVADGCRSTGRLSL